jgi:NAD+ synthase
MKNIEKKIVAWLRLKMKEAEAKGLICGISGGVDSAVVAALIKKAAGKNHLCLVMPCHSVGSDEADAKSLAKKFGLNTHRVDLTDIYDAFMNVLPEANSIAKANIKPRLRMITLYYFANKLNYLVVGTGNKSEALMGYFTKYGDGGVDLLPLGDLLKKDVRALAGHLGVPGWIIDKPPSAGLWHGQTDEGEMGVTYGQLDAVLQALETKNRPQVPKAVVSRIKAKMRATGHKRAGPEIFSF